MSALATPPPGPALAASAAAVSQLDRLTAAMAARGFAPGDPLEALAGELTVNELCAAEWPCPTCARRARQHIAYLAVDGTGRWCSVAFCAACGTGEDL